MIQPLLQAEGAHGLGGGVLYFGHPDIDARVSDVAYEPIAISFFFHSIL